MREKVTQFKSLKIALKELEPFVRDSRHLWNGKPLKRFGELRPRELWGNWLLCVAVNAVTAAAERLTFTTDPEGIVGDGVIYDTVTERACPMEHVLARRTAKDKDLDAETLILRAVNKKQKKGAAYASGKTLAVLLEDGGEWIPNKVAKQLPELDFEAVWVIGLQGVQDGEYVYNVTRLDLSRGNAPVWRVRIAKDFDDWNVDLVQ